MNRVKGLRNSLVSSGAKRTGRIVDAHVSQRALVVNDKRSTRCVPSFLEQHAIVARDRASQIGENGNLHLAEAALVHWGKKVNAVILLILSQTHAHGTLLRGTSAHAL